jgi:RimJ/RimL family protein N-acetyltransferase
VLVPEDFKVPTELATDRFRLEPLGPKHNDSDYAAWTSSIEHIRRTPGLVGWGWPPDEMTPEQNLADLEEHAKDFEERTGFTYTVLDPDRDEVIGCVYIYPSGVRSWVRADRAELDKPLYEAVRDWLAGWPLKEQLNYAPR